MVRRGRNVVSQWFGPSAWNRKSVNTDWVNLLFRGSGGMEGERGSEDLGVWQSDVGTASLCPGSD